ncbi:MAG: hypothetical protein KGL02_10810, partial [Acidobacteriota bacterium]|nr:hypothetical protein [Acidobacteriota bacterium]
GGRLPAVLDENARVRRDFGFPIMVTPYSQFVGAQAVLNVIAGARYKQVSDEIIQYASGFWGEEESASISPDIRDQILDRPRAKVLMSKIYSQPNLQKIREQYGGVGISDDELLLNFFTGVEQVAQMRRYRRGGLKQGGIAQLIETLGRSKNVRNVHIQRGEKLFTMQAR